MSLQMTVVGGPDVGRLFTLQSGDSLMLGRAATCYYRLSDPEVSRVHCELLLDGDQAKIIGCGSGDTIVNGKAVMETQVRPGDTIKVGHTVLKLHTEDSKPGEEVDLDDADDEHDPHALKKLTGQRLSHYQLGQPIGCGRVGMVFHAQDMNDGHAVALKVLLHEFALNDEEIHRFIKGMKTALPLRHPNLVTLLGAGKSHGHAWIAMECVGQGKNLHQIIAKIPSSGMIDWKQAFKVARQLSEVLAFVHPKGIVHRNITPTNCLCDPVNKVIRLGDLVLAQSLADTQSELIARHGELIGDVEYMAPERAEGVKAICPRSDLYGIGAVCYGLLTGRGPAVGSNLTDIINSIRLHTPKKPRSYQPNIPQEFENVVMTLLAKDPNARYFSAQELLQDLDRIGKALGVAA